MTASTESEAKGAMRRRGLNLRPLSVALLILVLGLVPLTGQVYWVWIVSNALLLGVFAAGFNLLFGYTGLLSFGHAGFFGIGAYVSALVLLQYPSILVAVMAGVAAAGIGAVVVGFLSLRHTDIYFAMLTLAFGMMIHSIIWRWRGVTGGDDGIRGVPRGELGVPGVASVDLGSLATYYYLILVVAVAAVFVLWRIVRSPFGLALQGIRDNANRVEYAGLPAGWFRLVCFTLSGMFAGLAGSLFSPLHGTAVPSMVDWEWSAEPVLAALLGGAHTFAGPLVGAFVLYVGRTFTMQFTPYWLLVLGTVVIVLVLGFRGGLVPAWTQVVYPRLRALIVGERSHE